jgi:hypothetical protein
MLAIALVLVLTIGGILYQQYDPPKPSTPGDLASLEAHTMPPLSPAPPNPPYPVNESGQTYGAATDAISIETLPDLILAGRDESGKLYIYTKELLASMPATPEEAQDYVEHLPTFTLYRDDGKTAAGLMGECACLLPESIRNEFAAPIYPLNENGQTYGADGPGRPYSIIPDLIAAMGIDGTNGYVYKTDLIKDPPKNPEEAIEYMRRQNERYEEMQRTGEEYAEIIPLYAADGVSVIGEFGIGGSQVIYDRMREEAAGASEEDIDWLNERYAETMRKAEELEQKIRLLVSEVEIEKGKQEISGVQNIK